MGEKWLEECEMHLKQVRAALLLKDADRLDLVKSMHRAILALNHSVLGWFQYVNNPDIMSMFSIDELNEFSDSLNKFAESFIQQDIKITKKGMEKGSKEIKKQSQNQHSFYV